MIHMNKTICTKDHQESRHQGKNIDDTIVVKPKTTSKHQCGKVRLVKKQSS